MVSVEVQLRKDASMTYLPRVYLMKSIENPLVDATAAEDSFTMTNSIDTWESDTFTVDNSAGDYDLDYALWFVGQNATGSVYSAYKLRQLNTDLTLVLENLAIVDTVVDAIKTKTDQLAFTVANQVDANALTGSATAEDVRIEMDANSTKLAEILTDTGTDGVVLKASGLAADAVTEIQSGLALETTLNAVKAKTDLITTGTAITIVSPVSGSTITAHRGDTLSAALENIGALTNYSKLWFTVKRDYDDADTAAVIQIEKTGGLLYLNGAAGTTGNGSLTINDVASGDVTIVLNASETAKLSPGNYQYDIQILRSAGTPVSTLTYGEFVVPADVTRATS